MDGLDEAIDHIYRYGSHHTEAIICEDEESSITFMRKVDSASVMWSASTLFSDGYRYGLGAEVSISTGKINARGLTGLKGLTTYKHHIMGPSQSVKKKYIGKNVKKLKHRLINKTWKEIA